MGQRKYTSFTEIDQQMEILKLEREIYLKKMVLSVDKTRQSIMPSSIINSVSKGFMGVLNRKSGGILKMILPLAIGWFLKRKRGK